MWHKEYSWYNTYMALYEKRKKAHNLRRRGFSVGYIAKALEISKTTASKWCLDVVLSEQQRQNLRENSVKAGHKGRMRGVEVNKFKKKLVVESANNWAREAVGSLSEREILIAGAALYWSEGSKSSSTSGFLFVNSDPSMILFMLVVLRQLGVKKEDIFCKIQINETHRKRIGKVLKFWQKLLDLPRTQFGKHSFVKSKAQKVYENYENYFGICRLGVRRSSILKYRMIGLIENLKLGKGDIMSA